MIQLRPYQSELIEECRCAYRSGHRRVCLCSPTGSGKTVLFSFVTKTSLERGQNTMILAHRSEILDQIEATMVSVGVPVGVVRAEEHSPAQGKATIASVQTLVKRFDRTPVPDLVIVDECHHAVAGTWAKVFAQYPKARFLGVTATPERMDGRGLGELFDHLVIGPSVSDLIAQGYLATPRYFRPPNAPDVSSLHMRMGEFAMDEAEALMDKPSITGDAVAHYKQHLYPRTAVAFCISIEHAHHVSESFRANGVTSAVIDGKMTRDERREMVKDLASGAIQVLTSCDLISEGFDLPSVGGAILLRPTGSLSTHIQQIGRPLRPKKDGSKAIILDHVGNVMRHGPAEKPREWSLDSRKRTSKQENDPQNKTCRECFCIFQGPRCPECGQAPVGKPREIEVVEGTLEEVDVAALLEKREKRIEVGRAQTLEELIQIGKDRKYSPQWAFIRWNISPHNPKNRKQMTLV